MSFQKISLLILFLSSLPAYHWIDLVLLKQKLIFFVNCTTQARTKEHLHDFGKLYRYHEVMISQFLISFHDCITNWKNWNRHVKRQYLRRIITQKSPSVKKKGQGAKGSWYQGTLKYKTLHCFKATIDQQA